MCPWETQKGSRRKSSPSWSIVLPSTMSTSKQRPSSCPPSIGPRSPTTFCISSQHVSLAAGPSRGPKSRRVPPETVDADRATFGCGSAHRRVLRCVGRRIRMRTLQPEDSAGNRGRRTRARLPISDQLRDWYRHPIAEKAESPRAMRIALRTRLQIVPTAKKEIAKNISIKVVHEAGVGVELQPLTPERIGERAAITWEDIRQYVQSFRAIPLGKTSRDKFRILLNNLRVISYPFEEAWIARHSAPLFRQRKTLYRCRKGDLVFCCANVGDELQFLESYEPHTWAELRKVTAGDFINVGSSIGVFAVSMAYSLGSNGRVVAIE